MQDWYQQRSDHLEERHINRLTNTTTERFSPGGQCHLLRKSTQTCPPHPRNVLEEPSYVSRELARFCSVHRYSDTEREMEFTSVRVDSLVRRVELMDEMTETFEGRDDFLCLRQVRFADTDHETDPIIRRLKVERFSADTYLR